MMPRLATMTKFERLECIILYGNGMTIDELGEFYDRHRGTIDALIRRTVGDKHRRGHSLRKRGPRVFKYSWEKEFGHL